MDLATKLGIFTSVHWARVPTLLKIFGMPEIGSGGRFCRIFKTNPETKNFIGKEKNLAQSDPAIFAPGLLSALCPVNYACNLA